MFSFFLIIFLQRQGLTMLPRLVLNSWAQVSTLTFPSAGITGMSHCPGDFHFRQSTVLPEKGVPTWKQNFWDGVWLYHPGWSAGVRSQLTATSASWVQEISPASASQVAGTIDARHNAWLVETGFHQAGLELLTSGDPPTSLSQCWDYRYEWPRPAGNKTYPPVAFELPDVMKLLASRLRNSVICDNKQQKQWSEVPQQTSGFIICSSYSHHISQTQKGII